MRTLILLSLFLFGCDPMPSMLDGGADAGEPSFVLRASCFLYAEGPERCVVGGAEDSMPWACSVGRQVPEGASIRAYLCEPAMPCEEIPAEDIVVDGSTLSAPCTIPVSPPDFTNGQWVRFEIY